MLVLSRQEGQQIMVGENIVITVVQIKGNGAVRLGIEAPKELEVDRAEVRERKRRSA